MVDTLERGKADAGRAAERAACAALPCLNSNKCNETPIPRHLREAYNRLSTNHRKTAFKLAKSVERLCSKYGIERVGFLTPSFADHVTCAKEAGRRFKSLRTGVLSQRYVESICVLERMKSGRIHFHLLVVLADDIRTGFDFDQASRRDYSSANAALRAEWKFWRSITNYDGKHPHHPYAIFGRTELMPVKSNRDGISKYVGKYIEKHVGAREERDKGVRLVRYSQGANIGSNAFMFVSPRSRLWRWQVGEFARRNECADLSELKAKFGRRWAHHQQPAILSLEPPSIEVAQTKDGQSVTLYDIWHADRVARAAVVAEAIGCSSTDVFASLYQSHRPTLGFDVPRWSGVNVARQAIEDAWERTMVWADGTCERV